MQSEILTNQAFNTRMRIVDALDALTKSKPFDAIKVTEICNAADVSRTTFYHYFDDKNAVLQWHSNFIYTVGIYEIGRSLNWYEGHYLTTQMIENHSLLYRAAGESQEYSALRPTFRRRRLANFKETLVDYQGKKLTDNLFFQMHAAVVMESELSTYRLRGELDQSVEEYCDCLVRSVPAQLYDALNEPVTQRDATQIALLTSLISK